MLARFRGTFGDGFHQRAQEAIKCHHSLAYLACCAMCGAAAESLLLAAATAQIGNEAEALKIYLTSGGRRRLEQRLTGTMPGPVPGRFRTLLDLLSYWRDASAHGASTDISEIEAFDAIGRLLRLAHLASDHWTELTMAR